MPVPLRLGEALAEAGPSITLAAAAETLAFALGGLTSMPAVRNFALCAALAIFLDFLLQVRIVGKVTSQTGASVTQLQLVPVMTTAMQGCDVEPFVTNDTESLPAPV